MNKRLVMLAAVGVLVGLVLSTAPAFAQGFQGWFSYSAKFVCGRAEPQGETVVGGRYRTVINIHNPHYLTEEGGAPRDIVFFKKAVLALPQGNELRRPSCKQMESLPADHALAVSCRNIIELFAQSGIAVSRPFEGFLVIELPPQDLQFFFELGPLDVTAVYTASQRTVDDGAQTIEVVPMEARPVQGIPNEDPCLPPG